MDAFLLMDLNNPEQGCLKAFKDENILSSKQQKAATFSPKTFRTPVADRTRFPKKAPQKPRKNKDNTRRDFRLITGADVVRALTFD